MIQGLRSRTAELRQPLRSRGYCRIWAADAISGLGDWAGRLALIVLVHDATGSAAWAAAVTAVSLAGFVGLGQLLATAADRYGRVQVMLVTDGARAACFLAMVFVATLTPVPVWALLVLAFLAGLCSPPFEAARAAAVPDLVPERSYPAALTLSGITVQAELVVGYALGGALLVILTPTGALAANAATFLVSAVILLPLLRSPAALPAKRPASAGASLRAAGRQIARDPLIRRALALITITGALGTVAEALVVPYAAEAGFALGATGLLAAAVPVGTLLAVAIVPTAQRHSAMLRRGALASMVAAGLAAPLFWFGATGALAVAAFMIAGGIFAISIPTNTVFGTRLNRDTRGSAMGIAVGVLMGGQALGAALGGLAAIWVGTDRAIAAALALTAAYCLWAAITTPADARHLASSPRVRWRAAAGPIEIDLRSHDAPVEARRRAGEQALALSGASVTPAAAAQEAARLSADRPSGA